MQHASLQAAGDTATMQRLDDELRELQALAHRQGFGGAPIPELLWLNSDAEPVGLSLALAEASAPDEKMRRKLPEVLEQKPVPLDRIED